MSNPSPKPPPAPHPPRLSHRAIANTLFCVERALTLSLRWRCEMHPEAETLIRSSPVIFAAWHNRLALALAVHRRIVLKLRPGAPLAALVSASKDGAFLAAILERFGVKPIRGSTSRRGAQALLELTRCAERGFNLCITPDGPRGPCYRIHPGIVQLSQVSGLPIIPTTYNVHPKIRLKSWDRFIIPTPFAQVTVRFGKPMPPPASGQTEAIQKHSEELRAALMQISEP